MNPERHVRLLHDGRNQTLPIPPEFELPGDEAIIRKEGGCLIIEPVKHRSLLEVLATLEPIDEDFPEIDDMPPLDDVVL